MTENEIYKAIRSELIANLNKIEVKQAQQNTQQGISFNPVIYMFFISHYRYGYLQRLDSPEGDVIKHIERQPYETVLQFTGHVLENPDTQLTSLDILNDAADILQSDKGRLSLKEKGIKVLRITDIRHVFTLDEQGRNQSTPSFDLTIQHERVKESTTPITQSFEFKKYRV